MQSYGYLIGDDGGRVIEISEARLHALLWPLIREIDVDDEWYLIQNPDVKEAIESGVFASAKDHYRRAGYFENRPPYGIKVDQTWYFDTYKDVLTAFENGVLVSAQEHFTKLGFKEGRLPYENFSLVKK